MIRENQTTLIEKSIYTTTPERLIFINFTKKDTIWFTLKTFYHSTGSLCKKDIRLAFLNSTRGYISINSLTNNIQRLLDNKMIELIARNVGPNKRTKYYCLTTTGESIWEAFIEQTR